MASWSYPSSATGETGKLIDDAVGLGYFEPGFLLYGDHGSLMAVPVDLEAVAVTGTPVPLFFDRSGEDVLSHAISETGTLAYIVTPDGVTTRNTSVSERIHVVVNWFEELRLLLASR